MGYRVPVKSWKLKNRTKRPEKVGRSVKKDVDENGSLAVAEEIREEYYDAEDVVEFRSVLRRLWDGKEAIPKALLDMKLNLDIPVEEQLVGDLGAEDVATNELVELTESQTVERVWPEKTVNNLLTSFLKPLTLLTARWYAAHEFPLYEDSVDLALATELLLSWRWIIVLEQIVQEVESDGPLRYQLEKSAATVIAVYLNVLLAVSNYPGGIRFSCEIGQRLTRFSLATDKLVPLAVPIIRIIYIALAQLPNNKELPRAVARPTAATGTVLRKSSIKLNAVDKTYELECVNSAVAMLISYIRMLHLHPSFCETSIMFQPQVKRLARIAEKKQLASRIAQTLKTTVHAIDAASKQIESARADLDPAVVNARIEIFTAKQRRLWGIETLFNKQNKSTPIRFPPIQQQPHV